MTDPRIDTHKATLHRTEHYTPEQVEHLKESANRQEQAIAKVYFNAFPKGLTPSEAHKKHSDRMKLMGLHSHKDHSWPITSTRRSITNLTDDGILEKTDKTRPGPYDKNEHVWKWKAPKQAESQGEMFKPKPKSNTYDPSYG